MLCSSCKRRETVNNFKTCEPCRFNKRAYYYRIKEKRERENKEKEFDDADYIKKFNFYCDALRITISRINDNCYERKHVENIKKIFEFLDDYIDRELYINKITNEEVYNELRALY